MSEAEVRDAELNLSLNTDNVSYIMRRIGSVIKNLVLVSFSTDSFLTRQVYIFEYIIIVSFSERATVQYLKSSKEFERNAYKNILLCYYIGMFLGRTSLTCLTLGQEKITLVSALQCLNTCIFFTAAKYEWMGVVWMMALML